MRSFQAGALAIVRTLTIAGAEPRHRRRPASDGRQRAPVLKKHSAAGPADRGQRYLGGDLGGQPRDLAAASGDADRPDRAAVERISLGGEFIRVRLSNEFGDKPLVVGDAHIAMAAGQGATLQPGSDLALTFGGKQSITIPAGARVLSDPVRMHAPAMSNVAVSLYFPQPTGAVTEDYFAMATGYEFAGDVVAAPEMPGAATFPRRVILSGIDVSGPSGTKVVVALGDSLTGGFGSSVDANHRWPDRLAERLTNNRIGVVNAGIGGNRLLHDFFGPNALARFDRDVLSQPSVGYMIVELGINDLGLPGGREELRDEDVSADDMIAGYQQLIERAHSYGIKVFMGTIPPFGGFNERPGFYSDAAEAKRQAINQWIRLNRDSKGAAIFEGVVDFEAAVRDPRAPSRLAPQFDSGDHLDPNDAGYAAMGDAVEMRLFQ